MPKILIKEIDKTSAGTPGEYSNNSVLICGFSQRTNEEIIEADPTIGYTLPDENGIFEFYTQDDFKKTIGQVSPILSKNTCGLTHYGNQMAYELLGQGYPCVIYISLGSVPKTDIEIHNVLKTISGTDPNNTDIWEIFKDKASYDFRFITHGLLNSCETHDTSEAKAAMDEAERDMGEPYTDWINAKEAETSAQALLDNAEEDEQALKNQEGYDAASEEAIAAKNAVAEAKTTLNKAKQSVTAAEKIYLPRLEAYNKAKEEYDALADAEFTTADFVAANEKIINLATYTQNEDYEAAFGTGRGDCVALIEVDETSYLNNSVERPEAKILNACSKMNKICTEVTGPYCACTVPSVVYKMTVDDEYEGNTKFPGAFHYLACYKRMIDANFAEWYAAAGYNRGISSYTVDHTTVKLGEVAIQALEPRYQRGAPYNYEMPWAVNVIANFRGSYYLWGNRTCNPLGTFDGGDDLTAQHFLNIRQLCTTIKKQLYVSCRRFTFDPNSDVLWINFKNSITPTLERMKADQGIKEYKIEKVYTDKKATLRARIRIVPIEAVEDFVLELSLEDSLGDVGVSITE